MPLDKQPLGSTGFETSILGIGDLAEISVECRVKSLHLKRAQAANHPPGPVHLLDLETLTLELQRPAVFGYGTHDIFRCAIGNLCMNF